MWVFALFITKWVDDFGWSGNLVCYKIYVCDSACVHLCLVCHLAWRDFHFFWTCTHKCFLEGRGIRTLLKLFLTKKWWIFQKVKSHQIRWVSQTTVFNHSQPWEYDKNVENGKMKSKCSFVDWRTNNRNEFFRIIASTVFLNIQLHFQKQKILVLRKSGFIAIQLLFSHLNMLFEFLLL